MQKRKKGVMPHTRPPLYCPLLISLLLCVIFSPSAPVNCTLTPTCRITSMTAVMMSGSWCKPVNVSAVSNAAVWTGETSLVKTADSAAATSLTICSEGFCGPDDRGSCDSCFKRGAIVNDIVYCISVMRRKMVFSSLGVLNSICSPTRNQDVSFISFFSSFIRHGLNYSFLFSNLIFLPFHILPYRGFLSQITSPSSPKLYQNPSSANCPTVAAAAVVELRL